MNLRLVSLATVSLLAVLPALGACTAMIEPPNGTGGATGGTGTGGATTGGSGSGGAAPGTGGMVEENWREGLADIPAEASFQFVRKIVGLWNPSCVGADCHGGIEGHVRLVPDSTFYDTLLNAVSDDVCFDENDMPQRLIVPGEPENSAFLRILEGPCEAQGRMPGGMCVDGSGECLGPEHTNLVRAWIAGGAPETGVVPSGSGGGSGSGGSGSGGAGTGGSSSGGASSGGASSGGASSGGASSGGSTP